MRDEAAASGDVRRWGSAGGYELAVLPHGAIRYPVVLECNEFRLHVTDSTRLPTVWVQVRSSFIHEVGVERAVAASLAAAADVAGCRLSEPHASRVDVYVDVANWRMLHADLPGVVTHALLRSHFRAGTDEIQTLQAGKSPLLVRVYRKDIQVRQKGGFAPLFWGEHQGPVTRVEVQMSSERLHDFGLATVSEVLASTGDMWRYATKDFLELRVPGPGDREDWAVRPEWRVVQSLVPDRFPCTGVVPFRMVHGDRVKVLQALLGSLTSLGAIDDQQSLTGLLQALPALLLRSREDGLSGPRSNASVGFCHVWFVRRS